MKKRKGTKSVVVDRPLTAKMLIVGALAVVTLAVCLSVGAAKGVFGSLASETGAEPAVADNGGVTTGEAPRTLDGAGQGLAAMSQAAADRKYLFAFFWSDDNDQTAAMRRVFADATAKVADRARTVSVRVSDPAESGMIKKYDLERAPMPLVLAIAPNGAVTGGFPTQFAEHELLSAFATPSTEQCMKALQDGKRVFLCVQNESTTSSQEALQGVQDFKADERYANTTEIVVLDPRDPAEASFLADLKIDPQTTTPVTVFLMPPSAVIGKYEGATTKEQFIAALEQAKTGGADTRAVTNASSPVVGEDSGPGLAALAQAAAENKYLFAFFWSADDDQTAAMRNVLEHATAQVADRAMTVSVRVGDPAERGIIKKYDLERAPMPLVLAIAPNGAVTGGFPMQCEEQDLLDAFTTPGTEQCLKALQDGKLVFVCVQNASTKSNQEALRGAQDFKADARYAGATEILVLDPRDPAEASFLGTLQIDPRIATAVTAFLKPPGSVIGAYQGATTKEQLIAALQQANASAGPDGGPPK